MLVIATSYILSGFLIWHVESARIRKYGPDLLTIFILMLVIQVLIPSAVLLIIKELYGVVDTGVPFFNNVLNGVGFYEASIIFLLYFLFIFSLYISWLSIDYTINLRKSYIPQIKLSVSRWRWLFVMVMGLICFFILVKELGGYNNLVLFRIDSDGLNRNFVTANLFSLSTTFLMLSSAGIMIFGENKKSIKFIFSLACVISFSLMTVSRRSLLIVFLLIFFTSILEKKKIVINKTMIFFLAMFVLIILFGKHFLFLLSHNSNITVSTINSGQANFVPGGIAKVAANIGITNIESWATLLYIDIPMRFGVDHLLSILRRIPDGLLGLNINFPERMVRISTQAFVGANRQDIPPGLIGQMWLDFRIFGPVIWGMMFALIISFLQILYNLTEKGSDGIFLFVLLIYTISLPIRSGTFDFVFSVDVFFLIIFMAFISKIKIRKVT